LSEGSGIQWPCTPEAPDGTERLYTDAIFNTEADYCETWGDDLLTGAAVTEEEYRADNPRGRARIKPADYVPPSESPDRRYPYWLLTGRVVYQFHTRTKTARSRELNAAAPDAFAQISEYDARKLGVAEGDLVEVASRRGKVTVPARVGEIEPGHVFIPFHYGYWDNAEFARAANELTISGWDAVSKQPHFKFAAVHIKKVG
jgi:anaerobic selenocysteine-containing dehydrogenase